MQISCGCVGQWKKPVYILNLSKNVFCLYWIVCISLDFNECTTNQHNCHEDATCNNTRGSWNCFCNQGYTGSGTLCQGISLFKLIKCFYMLLCFIYGSEFTENGYKIGFDYKNLFSNCFYSTGYNKHVCCDIFPLTSIQYIQKYIYNKYLWRSYQNGCEIYGN